MKGFRVWGLGFSLIITFAFLYPIPYTLYPTYAAESTPSAETKSKLEELKQEIASKAAALNNIINKKITKKAYVGIVKTKSNSTITLDSKNGSRTINITQDTIFESQKSKKYSQKLMSKKDYIAALGDVDENQVLTAKKLMLLSPLPQTLNPKLYLWGQIISISDKLVTLKDKNLKTISVSLNQKVKLNDFVILTGIFDKKDIFQADFIYIIPQGGFIKMKKMATPSARPLTPERSDGEQATKPTSH